jgi:hypothetical protein
MKKTYNFAEQLSQGNKEVRDGLETILPVLYRKLQKPTTGSDTRHYNPTAEFHLYHSRVSVGYYFKQINPTMQ